MKLTVIELTRRYLAALRKHLKRGPGATLSPALALGRQALSSGLETLALARIHEGALAALEISNRKNNLFKRAEAFFTEALSPIVETHRAARQSWEDLARLNKALDRRTAELATSNRQLKRGIVRRKGVEAALKLSGARHARSLKDSLQLQNRLRRLAHKIITAQEAGRNTLSHQLQDEIAQTLLGINIRLLTLKRAAGGSTVKLAKDIASTQRLVEASVKSINRFAHELNLQSPA